MTDKEKIAQLEDKMQRMFDLVLKEGKRLSASWSRAIGTSIMAMVPKLKAIMEEEQNGNKRGKD